MYFRHVMLLCFLVGVLQAADLANFALRGGGAWQFTKAQALPDSGFLLEASGSVVQMIAPPQGAHRFSAAVRCKEKGLVVVDFIVFDQNWRWLRSAPILLEVEGGDVWRSIECTLPAIMLNPASERVKFSIRNVGTSPLELGAVWLASIAEDTAGPEAKLRSVFLANTTFDKGWLISATAKVNAETKSLAFSGAKSNATLNAPVILPANAPSVASLMARNASERPSVVVVELYRYLRAGWKWQAIAVRVGAVVMPAKEFSQITFAIPPIVYNPETEALKFAISAYGTVEIAAPKLETTQP